MSELDDRIAEIQAGTPDGWVWRVRIDYCFSYQVQVSLKREKWYQFGKYEEAYWVEPDWTVEDFASGVSELALKILKRRGTALNTPDWAKLARELQEALNAK